MLTDLLLIGAHVSIADGFDKALLRAKEIDAKCIQIFTKSNRQWYAKKITTEEIKKFRAEHKKNPIPVIAHSSYLINLGSGDSTTVAQSKLALVEELSRCDMLKIPYLVLHPGTLQSDDKKKALSVIATNINEVLKKAKPKQVTLLLENMAGQGSTAGSTFEELGFLLKKIKNKKHIGICFDTCHAFASGYDFSTKDSYKKMWNSFKKQIGIKKLKVIHINDSKNECGSKIDRHEHIGKGKMNKESFALLLKDKRFINIPKILETPQDNPVLDNKQNLATLKKYFAQ